jgi:hypothetical protein
LTALNLEQPLSEGHIYFYELGWQRLIKNGYYYYQQMHQTLLNIHKPACVEIERS